VKKISQKLLYAGKWLALQQSTFVNDQGKKFCWEHITRTRDSVSCVILAQLIPSKRYVLIKQFRPAINNYIIGLPAGLCNKTDKTTIKKVAIKELKEETGYTGKVVEISPNLQTNPGIIWAVTKVVIMEIDENAKVNKKLEQSLETAEEIEVVLKKKKDIKQYLISENKKGNEIGAGLWYLFH